MLSKQEVIATLCRTWKVHELKLYGQFTLARDKETKEILNFGNRPQYGFFRNFKINDRSTRYPKIEGLEPRDHFLSFKQLAGNGLKDGQYYWVTLEPEEDEKREPNPYLLKIAGVEILADDYLPPREFIEDWFHKIGGDPLNASTIARQLSLNELELYTKTERFIFELIQNADDMPASLHGVEIETNLLDRFFIFRHTGKHFQRDDVKAICNAAQSSKRQEVAMTGYKGIGFKSVFTDSVRVFIRSGDYSFKFDKEAPIYRNFRQLYEKRISELNPTARAAFFKEFDGQEAAFTSISNIPWQIKPIWVDRPQIPQVVAEHLHGYNVCIALEVEPTTLERKEYDKMIRRLLDEPRFLLFLKNVRSIKYTAPNGDTQIIEVNRRGTQTNVKLNGTAHTELITWSTSVPVEDTGFAEAGFTFRKVNAAHDNITRFTDANGASLNNIPEKLARLNQTTISFAAQVINGTIQPLKKSEAILFNYLPTEDKSFELPFLVNADFITNNSREFIQIENVWNHYLMFQVGYNAILWLQRLARDQRREIDPSFLQLLPRFNKGDERPIYSALWRGVAKAVEKVAFLPTEVSQPVLVKDAVIDLIGLQTVLGNVRFASVVGHSVDHIVYRALSTDAASALRLSNLKPAFICDWGELAELITAPPLTKWLREPQNNGQFILWLIKKRRLEDFANCSIFLDQTGRLQPASALYRNLGSDQNALAWAKPLYLHPQVDAILLGNDIPQLKSYSPRLLLNEVLVKGTDEVDTTPSNKSNNYAFWRYAFENRSILNKDDYAQLRKISFYDHRGALVQVAQKGNRYSYAQDLAKLVNSNALPSDHIQTTAADYAAKDEEDAWAAFWGDIGMKAFEHPAFLKQELAGRASEILKHYKQAETENQPVQETLSRGNYALWSFIQSAEGSLSGNELTTVQKSLGGLPVLQKSGSYNALNASFLGDEYHDTPLAGLLNQFRPDAAETLVAPFYAAQSGSTQEAHKLWHLWKRCGIKYDAKDLVADILNDMGSLEERLQIEALLLCSSAWKQLTQPQKDAMKRLPIKLQNDSWAAVTDCILGETYTATDILSTTLRDIPVSNLVSVAYLTKQSQREELTQIFRELGAKVPTTLDEVLALKVPTLVDGDAWNVDRDVAKSVAVVSELAILHKDNKLSAPVLAELHKLQLIASSGGNLYFYWADNCYLSSGYGPKFDLEALGLSHESLPPFVSDKYSGSHVTEFLLAIGVMEGFQLTEIGRKERNDMPADYIEAIDRDSPRTKSNAESWSKQHFTSTWIDLNLLRLLVFPEVAKRFWGEVQESKTFRERLTRGLTYNTAYSNSYAPQNPIENYTAFFIRSNPTIPNRRGVCRNPSSLYSSKLEPLIQDNELIPFKDFSALAIDGGRTLEDWLHIKREPDLAAVLKYLETKPYYSALVEHDIWNRLKELCSNLDEDDQEQLNEFKQSGSLPSQVSRVWRPLSELFVLDDRDNFGIRHNSWLLNNDAKELSEVFGIAALSVNDLQPEYEPLTDSFKQELLERLKYVVFILNPNDWEEKCNGLHKLVSDINFIPTRQISMRYSNGDALIESTDKTLFVREDSVVYVLRREGVYDDSLYNHVRETVLGIKPASLSMTLLKDLLIYEETFVKELCKKHNPDSFPTAWDDDTIPMGPISTTTTPVKGQFASARDSPPKFESYSEEELEQAAKLMGRPLTNNEIADANLQAQIRGIIWLKEYGYDTNAAEVLKTFERNYPHGFLHPVSHPTLPGKQLTVMCRSALSGLLYVSFTAWENLAKDTHHLFVLRSKPHEHQIFKTQEDLGDLNDDAWIMRLDEDDKHASLNRFFRGEGKWGNKLNMIIRLPGNASMQDLYARKEIDSRGEVPLTGGGLDDEQ